MLNLSTDKNSYVNQEFLVDIYILQLLKYYK